MAKLAEMKQENIVVAAIEIFTEKGLEQATMEAISKKAEVSKRTLYKYYPTKESLFSVIIERLLSNIHELTNIQFDQNKSVKSQLSAIAKTEVELLCSPDFQSLSRMVLAECIRSADSAAIMMEKIQSLEGCLGLSQWIKAGIDADKLDVEHPEVASEQFFAAIKAVVFWPQILMHQPIASEEERQVAIETTVTQFLRTYLK